MNSGLGGVRVEDRVMSSPVAQVGSRDGEKLVVAVVDGKTVDCWCREFCGPGAAVVCGGCGDGRHDGRG